MAAKKNEKPWKSHKIQDTKGGNFGNYAEDTGGGHPYDAGDSNTRTTKENGKRRNDEGSPLQPRTNDGKFTYNSTNGHGLKYPPRGKTVNPLLTGGKNGIYIDSVKKQFENEQGHFWDKYKNEWYRKGDEAIVGFGKKTLKTKVSARDIWEIARRAYNEELGDFKLAEGNWDESKSGRHGKEEKAAMADAKKAHENQLVHKQAGGIKMSPKYANAHAVQIPIDPKDPNSPTMPTSIVVPNTPKGPQDTQETAVSGQDGAQGGQTAPESQDWEYNEQDAGAILDAIKQEYENGGQKFNPDDWTEDLLTEFINQQGGKAVVKAILDAAKGPAAKSELDEPKANGNQGSDDNKDGKEEDSDAIKKIKSMGFSE